jgi:hypothetical protein
MTERMKITKLTGKRIVEIERDKDRPEYIVFRDPMEAVLFTVHQDQLFDADGNRFEVNLT